MRSRRGKSKVAPFPAPKQREDGKSEIVIRVGGQSFRVELAAKITDITDSPKAAVIPIDGSPLESGQ